MIDLGEVSLWTSIQGFKNIREDRPFYAYTKESYQQCINISIPIHAVATFDYSVAVSEGVEFFCNKRSDWKL